MTSFNIDNWMNDIKNAFISTLEKSEVPLSYIEIAKKLKLNQHDDKNWFAIKMKLKHHSKVGSKINRT